MSGIIDQISIARHKYKQANNGREPMEIVIDLHVAELLRFAANKSMAKGDKLEKPEQLFGGRIFGMAIKRWPRKEKGFAVR
jgi:hypothetical protein